MIVLIYSAATDGSKERNIFRERERSGPETIEEYGKRWLETLSFEDWGSLAQTNLASVFFVTMAFLGLLEESTKHGEKHTASVINIGAGGSWTNISFGMVSGRYFIFLSSFGTIYSSTRTWS